MSSTLACQRKSQLTAPILDVDRLGLTVLLIWGLQLRDRGSMDSLQDLLCTSIHRSASSSRSPCASYRRKRKNSRQDLAKRTWCTLERRILCSQSGLCPSTSSPARQRGKRCVTWLASKVGESEWIKFEFARGCGRGNKASIRAVININMRSGRLQRYAYAEHS